MKNITKKALVTGGAGFIGSHLCEELLLRGCKVDAIDNLSTSYKSNISHLLKNKNFRFFKGSVSNTAFLDPFVKRCDIVYHLAAAVGVKYILDHQLGSLSTNIRGTEVVLKLAARYGKKVLIASTSEIYGKHICAPFKENDDRILGPTTVGRWGYATAKAIDEMLALAYMKERYIPVVIVRLFNTVGPVQIKTYGMVLPRLINQAINNKPLTVYGDGNQLRSFTYVKDAVDAIIALSLKKEAEGEVFNIGSENVISIKELARKISNLAPGKPPIKFISFKEAYGERSSDFEEMTCRIPDLSKIRRVINYEPKYDIDAIIKKTLEYHLSKKRRVK